MSDGDEDAKDPLCDDDTDVKDALQLEEEGDGSPQLRFEHESLLRTKGARGFMSFASLAEPISHIKSNAQRHTDTVDNQK